MRFKIFIAVKICFVVFWVITPNSPVCLYQSFIEIYCLYFQGRKIKIAAVSSFICWQPLARIHVVITQKTIRLSYSCHQTFTYLIAVHLRLQAECPHSFAPRFKSYLRDRLRFLHGIPQFIKRWQPTEHATEPLTSMKDNFWAIIRFWKILFHGVS